MSSTNWVLDELDYFFEDFNGKLAQVNRNLQLITYFDPDIKEKINETKKLILKFVENDGDSYNMPSKTAILEEIRETCNVVENYSINKVETAKQNQNLINKYLEKLRLEFDELRIKWRKNEAKEKPKGTYKIEDYINSLQTDIIKIEKTFEENPGK